MKKMAFLSIFIFSTFKTLACEPAALEWNELYLQMDKPVDSRLSWADFQKIRHFPPYSWPRAIRYQGQNGAKQLFNDLDKNQDGYVDDTELTDIYRYLPNPCSNRKWP